MDEQGFWDRLNEMKARLRTWDAVATELGLSKQYLSYCILQRSVTPKLLKAMQLEPRYVRAK